MEKSTLKSNPNYFSLLSFLSFPFLSHSKFSLYNRHRNEQNSYLFYRLNFPTRKEFLLLPTIGGFTLSHLFLKQCSFSLGNLSSFVLVGPLSWIQLTTSPQVQLRWGLKHSIVSQRIIFNFDWVYMVYSVIVAASLLLNDVAIYAFIFIPYKIGFSSLFVVHQSPLLE